MIVMAKPRRIERRKTPPLLEGRIMLHGMRNKIFVAKDRKLRRQPGAVTMGAVRNPAEAAMLFGDVFFDRRNRPHNYRKAKQSE